MSLLELGRPVSKPTYGRDLNFAHYDGVIIGNTKGNSKQSNEMTADQVKGKSFRGALNYNLKKVEKGIAKWLDTSFAHSNERAIRRVTGRKKKYEVSCL